MSIKFLAEDDRPREKFIRKGKDALSDSELLAIIMGSGNRDESAVDLARRILASVDNSWDKLSRLSLEDLQKFKGVGEAKAISIATALEIGRRKALQSIPEKPTITSSETAFQLLHPILGDLKTEEFWAIFLNQSNKVLQIKQLTSGGINQSVVDIRVLFKYALDYYSTAIIVAHNHPSGNLKPSVEDENITRKIKEAGTLLNIQLLDHLIVTQRGYISFADEGKL